LLLAFLISVYLLTFSLDTEAHPKNPSLLVSFLKSSKFSNFLPTVPISVFKFIANHFLNKYTNRFVSKKIFAVASLSPITIGGFIFIAEI
jgi:hypothetical protein